MDNESILWGVSTSRGTEPEIDLKSNGESQVDVQNIEFEVNGTQVQVPDDSATLLEALREHVGIRSAKDGCSPQGQCGCCTVLVDGQARVACVTPVKRVRGRAITTLEGMDPERVDAWSNALCATGGSQCGFCTPGIVVRLEGLRAKRPEAAQMEIERALAAHMCRCTGWQSIVEAWDALETGRDLNAARDMSAAAERAGIEGRVPQRVGPEVSRGEGGFAADTAPGDALVALRGADGNWLVGETLAEARTAAGKVQGRRTTLVAAPPLAVPAGSWAATLATNWVEPGYLETDVSWCEPGGEPASMLANGGAFGAKQSGFAAGEARRLADELGRPVRLILSREDAVRTGAKRPPVAGGANTDGSGEIHVVRTEGIAEKIAAVAPGLIVTEHDVSGPDTSSELRGAGWVEALTLVRAATGETGPITSPDGGIAEASIVEREQNPGQTGPHILVKVDAGHALDDVVLRSYAIGAAHMAWSWVTSESITVDADGEIHDLTIRSFGVLKASDTPSIEVEIVTSDRAPCNGSDAVFAAVAGAAWAWFDHDPVWPVAAG